MNWTPWDELNWVMQEVESNPDKTLFLMDVADPGDPWIKVPLGEDPVVDGYLILHPDGWFIHKDGVPDEVH